MALYTLFIIQKPKIMSLSADLEASIRRRCENPLNRGFYNSASGRIDKISWIFYGVLSNVIIFLFFVIHFSLALSKYIMSGYPNQISSPLPYPAWLPFNHITPVGYFFALLLQTFAFIGSVQSGVMCFIIFYAFCQILIAFTLDLMQQIDRFNAELTIERTFHSAECCGRLEQRLCKIIEFHGEAKQYAMRFVEEYKVIISAYLMYSAIMITTSLLEIQRAIVENNWPIFGRYSTFVIMALAWLYLFCNIGDEIKTRFQNIGDALYNGPWHKLPLNLRRDFPKMILMISQKPIYIQGFGNLQCTRETYKSIVKAGFSYFVVINQSMELQLRVYQLYRSFKSGPVNI